MTRPIATKPNIMAKRLKLSNPPRISSAVSFDAADVAGVAGGGGAITVLSVDVDVLKPE